MGRFWKIRGGWVLLRWHNALRSPLLDPPRSPALRLAGRRSQESVHLCSSQCKQFNLQWFPERKKMRTGKELFLLKFGFSQDLEEALRASAATWKIVVGHHAIRSASSHGDTSELVELLLPVLKVTYRQSSHLGSGKYFLILFL